MSLFTLTTDFGLCDSYVAEMKGVLLRGMPNGRVVDISHDIDPCNVAHGARVLANAVPQFPVDTIHIAVVDPGVGSNRRKLLLEIATYGERQYLVGPDNGLFSALLERSELKKAWQITSVPEELSRGSSTTFDGRDSFCPAAVLLAQGKDPAIFLQEIDSKVQPLFALHQPPAIVKSDGSIRGEIVYFDRFGNAACNIHRRHFDGNPHSYNLEVGSHHVSWVAHFDEIPENAAAGLFNSQGELEIAARQKSVKELLKLTLGTKVHLTTVPGTTRGF